MDITPNQLTDEEYLASFCTFMESYQISDVYVVVNNDGQIIFNSNSLLVAINDSNILGKKIKDLNSPLSYYASEYAQVTSILNKITINKPVTLEYLLIFNNLVHITVWQHFATKLINPHTAKHVGMVVTANRINPNNILIRMLSRETNLSGNLIVVSHYQDAKIASLSMKEHELLFLLALGKSHKQIAEILSYVHKKNILPITVTTWINRNLYTKFDVNSTSGLVEKAYTTGGIHVMPASFEILLADGVAI